MGVYQTPYLKFEFSSSNVNIHFFEYLKKLSKEQLMIQLKEFRKKEILEFKKDYKFERICLIVGRLFFLVSIISLVLIINFEDLPANIFAPAAILIFPSIFFLSLSYSYALTLRELKNAIKKRKNNLIKAQKIAKESSSFEEFFNNIIIK